MNKEQWITKYEKKAEPFSMTPGYNLWFRADKGFYPNRRKTPSFSYGDIRRVCQIYVSN